MKIDKFTEEFMIENSKNDDVKKEEAPKQKNEIWKLWLFFALLLAWIIGAQIENNSPSHQMHVRQALGNAKNIIYKETMNTCKKDSDTISDCFVAADNAAKEVDTKLNYITTGK